MVKKNICVLLLLFILNPLQAETITFVGGTLTAGTINGVNLAGQAIIQEYEIADGLTFAGGQMDTTGNFLSVNFNIGGVDFLIDDPTFGGGITNVDGGGLFGFTPMFTDNATTFISSGDNNELGAPLDGESFTDYFARVGTIFTEDVPFQMVAGTSTVNGGLTIDVDLQTSGIDVISLNNVPEPNMLLALILALLGLKTLNLRKRA